MTISPSSSSSVVVSVVVSLVVSALATSTATLTMAALAVCGPSSPPEMEYSAAGAMTEGALTPQGRIETGSATVSFTWR